MLAAPEAAAVGAAYVDLPNDIKQPPCEHSLLPTPAFSGLCPLNSAALAL